VTRPDEALSEPASFRGLSEAGILGLLTVDSDVGCDREQGFHHVGEFANDHSRAWEDQHPGPAPPG